MSRTSHTQFAVLVDFMERNGDLNNWPTDGSHGRSAAISKWEELCRILNSDGSGTAKTVEKWKKVWSDFKNNTKRKAIKIQRAASGPGGGPRGGHAPLSDLERRALVLAGAPGLGGDVCSTELGGEARSTVYDTPNLSLVMQCCMTLIQSHGSVVERVIDDPAFQKILTLTPLTAEERGRVTSEGVRGMMDEEEEDYGETDTSEVQEPANETEIEVPMVSVKHEIVVTHWQCSCDEISGRHDDACAAAVVDYLAHYRVSISAS
ncbi:uncharacterized protein LOC105388475 [Plutella xylostella]|uniref:uncharacterized protein LOC105388475 n=1 Tax=Plutella xylostella TaxID=51655 RepID=UPI0020330D25|nr:uncharacterized protein LOC105388475 [Plutella xylostella]